jgi:hypothetical protein
MFRSTRIRLAVVAAVATMSVGVAAAPASAQVDQDGLVNVAVTDTAIQVPVSVAANICDLNVGVLAAQVDAGPTNCDAVATTEASHQGGNGGGNVSQDGLVNVALVDVQIAVPIAVAANLCDINVGVLARQLRIAETQCNADADSLASHGTGGGGGARTIEGI